MEKDINYAKQQLLKLDGDYSLKRQTILDDLTAAQREQLGHKDKTIRALKSFNANGNKYIIRDRLTITRFEKFEDYQIKVGYGRDFIQLFNRIKTAYSHLNEAQYADASVVLWNIMNGIGEQLDKRENDVLMLCTLFMCREDEDIKTFDEPLMHAKIEDWRKEGIVIDDFFTLAFNWVNGFMPIYKEVSVSISSHREEVKRMLPVKPKKQKKLK